jgi:hypothetical protein
VDFSIFFWRIQLSVTALLYVFTQCTHRKLKEIYEKWDLEINLNKIKYLCIGKTHSNLKLDKNREIESCREYKYLEVIFYTSGTDDKEIRSRVIQARKCIACLNGILWSENIIEQLAWLQFHWVLRVHKTCNLFAPKGSSQLMISRRWRYSVVKGVNTQVLTTKRVRL